MEAQSFTRDWHTLAVCIPGVCKLLFPPHNPLLLYLYSSGLKLTASLMRCDIDEDPSQSLMLAVA
jgi:hypothetical protein